MTELLETDSKEKNIIYGYSERGIINSLIFNIGEDKELLKKFIELISLPEPIEIGNPKKFTILLEQSFSEFGDADLVIIIHYEKPEENKILFFEGKVKTFLGNWKIEGQYNKYNESEDKYNGYSSNLFFQLHLKKLLIEYCEVYNKEVLEEGYEEPKFKDYRKIGSNEIVKKAIDKLKGCKEAYYIGLIPTLHEGIKEFIKNNTDTGLHFLSWETVHGFCKDNQLNKVLEIFDYNGEQIYKPNK